MNSSSLSCVPGEVEQLLRNVFKYFKSSKRQLQFKELQTIFDVPEHKLLRLSDTRWLSFESVATRTLEQWTVLQHFFIQAQFEEKSVTNLEKLRVIQEGLSPVNKIYLMFLAYVFKIMNKLNKTFQSESSQIIYLVSSTKNILLELFRNFLKREHLNMAKFENIDYESSLYVKDVINIYIGNEAESEICAAKLPEHCIIDIKSNLLKFYQKLCSEILSRIDINDKKLNAMRFLDPTFLKTNEDINYFEIVSEFPHVITDPEGFINEFKFLESKINDKSYRHIFTITNLENFWYEIGKLKNTFDEQLFFNLYKFSAYVFTLPHSSATAERIFSKLALMKNKLTNNLKVSSCEDMLSALNVLDVVLEDWTPEEDLLKKYITTFPKN